MTTEISSCQLSGVYSWICQERNPSSRTYASCLGNVSCNPSRNKIVTSGTKKLLTLKVNLDSTTFDYDFRRVFKTCFKIEHLSVPETIGGSSFLAKSQ